MKTALLAWLVPAFLLLFVGLWALVSKLVAMMGWQQLAGDFAVAAPPPAPATFRVGRARVGRASYRQAVRFSVSPQGLGLTVVLPFRVGHPPLLLPWTALGPVGTQKVLFVTYYTVAVRTSAGPVNLQFNSPELLHAMQPWLRAR